MVLMVWQIFAFLQFVPWKVKLETQETIFQFSIFVTFSWLQILGTEYGAGCPFL